MRLLNLRGLAVVAVAMLAGCAQPPAPVVQVAPPAPVGHIYETLVAVPVAPKRLKISPAQQEETQQAFNVIGLKSALMVGALSCAQQSNYDAFMNVFAPHILFEQHVMDAYFKRIGGYYGQAREDNFVTLLANNQSVSGIGQGAVFCLNNTAEFQSVMALHTDADLDKFATDEAPPDDTGAAVTPTTTTAALVVPAVPVKHEHLADEAQQ